MAGIKIAVDIGGTFTDGIAEDVETCRIWVGKCLTTPDDPGEGVSEVVAQLLGKIGAGGSATVNEVVHGTTLVTNTLIERSGARTALLCTEGTADTLDIRREVRYDLYDLDLELPDPLIAPDDRLEVAERLRADGGVLDPLTDAEASRIGEAVAALQPEAVAICLLHAYVDDRHETRLAEAVERQLPGVPVSLSSRVAREIREYERMSTTVANAYVQPLMQRYLGLLEGRLDRAGIRGALRIMLSSGGFTASGAAADLPILLLESGPAAGVLSGVNTARNAGLDRVLAFDMGGTTAKACVAIDGRPDVAHSFEAARVKRFKRGSGLPMLIPSIDLIEIGAGGGSIARIDALGLMKIGPQSAGAVPGPACYGRGGTEATVTDADLMLGYLDPARFLGGEMVLDPSLAEAAASRLGVQLGLEPLEVAAGIADIVNENMAAAARIHIAEKGHDPRRFTLIATGGAGPVHAVEVARRLGIRRVLCPIAAGAGSCLGLLAAPARVDRSWSKPMLLDGLGWEETAAVMKALKREAEAELEQAGAGDVALEWSYSLEMRYAGQGSTITVTMPWQVPTPAMAGQLRERFEGAYRALYGDIVPGAQPQVVTWRLTGQSSVEARLFMWAEDRALGAPPRKRSIWQPVARDMVEVEVHDRYSLPPGTRLKAPVVLEERESTLVVPVPGAVTVQDDLSVLVELEEAPR
jgi:N-methylhydantoinase A